MGHKAILTVLAFGLSMTLFGQSFDPCETGRKSAEFKISSGTVYFPRLTTKSTYTLRKMLEIEYGIRDEVYSNGSDLQFGGEADCFFEVMKTEIDKRWGKDFLRKQRRIANSLDKQGQGYKDPKENGIADSIANFLKSKYPVDLKLKAYLVSIKISPDKEILDIALLSGLPIATEMSRTESDYQLVSDAVQRTNKVYEPGQFKGKKISSTLTFWIEL